MSMTPKTNYSCFWTHQFTSRNTNNPKSFWEVLCLENHNFEIICSTSVHQKWTCPWPVQYYDYRKNMSVHHKWSGSSFINVLQCFNTAISIGSYISDRFGYRPIQSYFSKHIKTSMLMFFGISKCRSWASTPSILLPTISAHV